MSVLWSDLRLGVRQVMKAPGFSLAAIATLALGIGPTTAIFTLVYATFLAPLPYQDPDQLVIVWSKSPSGVRSPVSSGDALAWKEAATSFQYSNVTLPREGWFSSIQRSKFHFTAAASHGVPSWKVTPPRRLKK